MGFDDTTYVLVNRPAAGRWTVETKPGSVPIADLRFAPERPEPRVRARVRGARAQLARRDSLTAAGVLRYSVSGADAVRWYERVAPRGGQFLGETRRASGALRFTPADAAGRRRTIVAQVIEDGVPRTSLTVARFSASRPAIGRPRGVRARKSGRRLVVTWGRAANATRYQARVTLSDGRVRLLFPRGRRLVIGDVVRGTRATIEVRGERPGPRLGPPTRRRVTL
jgi:hypothetical protein